MEHGHFFDHSKLKKKGILLMTESNEEVRAFSDI
jgi:hypothetical protein